MTKRELPAALQELIHRFHAHRVVVVSALNSVCILFISWLLVLALGPGSTPDARAENPRPEARPPAPVHRESSSGIRRAPRPERSLRQRSARQSSARSDAPRMGRRNYPVELREQPEADR